MDRFIVSGLYFNGGGEGEGHPKKSANMIDALYDVLRLEAAREGRTE